MIKINEVFGPTQQGEGKSAGMPVAFLRLSGCNLHCIFCDTPWTWNWIGSKWDHEEKFFEKDEMTEMSVEALVEKLEATGMKHLVISGGEPLIQHKQLTPLLSHLKALQWFVEIETNGTVVPNPEFVRLIDQINCSPKLANAGDSRKLRIKPTTLHSLSSIPKVNFKFVIQTEGDMTEVLDLVTEFKFREVRLMPECRTKEEMDEKEQWIRNLCETHGFIYCTRLSILWGNKRGT